MSHTGVLRLDYAHYRRIYLAPISGLVWRVRTFGVVFLLWGLPTRDALLIVLGLAAYAYEFRVLVSWQQTKLDGGPWRYEVSSSAIGVHTTRMNATAGWDAVTRTKVGRHAWVFRVAGSKRLLVIPRAAFTSEAQQEIDRFIRAR